MSVSLVNGRSLSYTGRVELNVGGIVGRICAKMWDDKDANVLCKQLNYKGGVAYRLKTRGTTPYIMGYVNCTGNETSLGQCPHTKVGEDTGCHFNDNGAGAMCYNKTGEYRRGGGGGRGAWRGWHTLITANLGCVFSVFMCNLSVGYVETCMAFTFIFVLIMIIIFVMAKYLCLFISISVCITSEYTLNAACMVYNNHNLILKSRYLVGYII